MKAAPIHDHEWDFSGIDDADVNVCCWYEYAREAERQRWRVSRDFLDAQIATIRSRKASQSERDRLARVLAEAKVAAHSGGSLILPLFQHFEQASGVEVPPKYLEPAPWRALAPAGQQTIRELFVHNTKWRTDPLAPPVCVVHPDDAEAARMASPESRCTKDPLLFPGLLGTLDLSLRIDLRNYPDSEIVAAFGDLLKQWRVRLAVYDFGDGSITGPGKSGTKPSAWRSQLEGLALMRLWNAVPKTLRIPMWEKKYDRFWGGTDGPSEISKKADRRRESVLGWFRGFASDLGPKAMPERWEKCPFKG